MDENVVHKCALRGEQSGVMGLTVLEPRGVVHGQVLDGGQSARTAEADLAHVADVEEAHGSPHGQVFGDQASARAGILDRHLPAAEVHHFGLEGAVGGVQSGFFERGSKRRG
jgi:hypothetical protein